MNVMFYSTIAVAPWRGSVLEICGTVGFESPASFSLLFRQSFGMTPVAARKLSKIR